MCIKTLVRLCNELLVKLVFTSASLVARYQQNCLPFRVESECYSPFATGRTEAELLHVRVAGAVQGVDSWPSPLWPELLQQARERENFDLHVLVQLVEFRSELIADFDGPGRLVSMPHREYAVKCIT